MSIESRSQFKAKALKYLDELLYNGFYYEGSDKVFYPTSQEEILEVLLDLYDVDIKQGTVSNYLKELNYFKDPVTCRYVKKDIYLYYDHREILLSYLKIKDYTIEMPSNKLIVTIRTRNLNTELLYELIIDSYPKDYIMYIMKGYNGLKVSINKDYVPKMEYEDYPLFTDDISEFARKNLKPKTRNQKK